MDDLKAFLRPMTDEQRQAFALRCGTTAKMLEQIRYGGKKANPLLCLTIQWESRGRVRCERLRPDLDWAHYRRVLNMRPRRAA